MILYIVCTLIFYEVFSRQGIKKYYVFPLLILLSLYGSSIYVPELNFLDIGNSGKEVMICIFVVGLLLSHYSISLFLEKNIPEKKIRQLLLFLSVIVVENYALNILLSVLFVVFETYERSKKAGYIIKTKLIYFICFAVAFLFWGSSSITNALEVATLSGILYLLVVEISKISLSRILAVVSLSLSGGLIDRSYVLVTTMSLLVIFVIVEELKSNKVISKKTASNLGLPVLDRWFVFLFIRAESSEKKYIQRVMKKVDENKESGFYQVGLKYSNDIRENFLLHILLFLITTLLVFLKGI